MSTRTSGGLTLFEWLALMAIIVLLACLLLPAVVVNGIGEPQPACRNNQHQIYIAIRMYEGTNQVLPPLRTVEGVAPNFVTINWAPPLLKELGRPDLYDDFAYNGKFPNDPAKIFRYIDILECPSDPRFDERTISSPLSYVLNGGLPNSISPAHYNRDFRENGVFDDLSAPISQTNPNSYRPASRNDLAYISTHDGASQTVMITENVNADNWVTANTEAEAAVLWQTFDPGPGYPPTVTTSPRVRLNADQNGRLDIDHARPSSRHPGGFLVTFCDGHTRFVSERIDYYVWARLMTCNGPLSRDPDDDAGANVPVLPYQVLPINEGDVR